VIIAGAGPLNDEPNQLKAFIFETIDRQMPLR